MISEAHQRGMYVLFDNTFATYVTFIRATSYVVC
jgi:glycosidase